MTQAAQIHLLEYTLGTTAETRVDRDKGVIYGVKILGEQSLNPPPRNHKYPRMTREKAIPIAEGAAVYIDHPPKGTPPGQARSYRDRNGTMVNVRESGNGLVADYHLNPEHATSKQIFWDAENAPGNFGFSINGGGRPADRLDPDGSVLIEEIPVLFSVDLVSRGATTKTCYESLDQEIAVSTATVTPPKKKKVRQLQEDLKTVRPGYVRALREMAEAGIMSPDDEIDDPGMKGPDPVPAQPAAAEEMDHETALKQGFRGAIVAVLDDDGLDMKAKLAKIKEIMKAEEKLIGGGGGGDTSVPPDVTSEESRKNKALEPGIKELREELARERADKAARIRVEDAGLKFTKAAGREAFIRSLIPLAESDQRELIEERRAQQAAAPTTPAPATGQKPLSAAAWRAPAPAAGTTIVQEVLDPNGLPVLDDSPEARAKRLQVLRSSR